MAVVADLSVRVGADIGGLTSGLNTANQRVEGFGQRLQTNLQGIGDRATRTAASLAGMTVPLGIGIALGINSASNFEDSLTEIQARTGLLGADMERIRGFALQMGQDTKFSGQEAADGFLQLLTSGQTVDEAFSTLPPVLDLAAASGIGLGQTADAVTDILSQFSLQASDSASVVDALTKASGASSATVSDLQQGFGNIGNVANSFGLSVNRTAAILAILSENGIKSAEAGTALKSVLLNLQKDDSKRTLRELGISMYDAQGNMRDFEAVITELDAKLDGMSTQQQNDIMLDLAGSYGITGLTALRGAISISEMENKMLAAADASTIADSKMGTFSGKLDTLKGSVDTLNTEAFTPFMNDVLVPMIDHTTEIVNNITDWVKENPALTTSIITLGGIAVGATAGLAGLGMVMGALSSVGLPLVLIIGGLALGIGVMNTEVIEGISVWELFSSGVITILDDVGRRFDIMAMDFTLSVLGLKAAFTALTGGDVAPIELEIGAINYQKSLYGVGDGLYQELGTQLRQDAEGDPITLTPQLQVQLEQDPAGLAARLSFPTRQMLTEAWNRASEQGDLNFLQDTAPLMMALQAGGLVVPEVDGTALDTSRMESSLTTAFNERLATMPFGELIFPMSTWTDPVAVSLGQAVSAIDPALLGESIDTARLNRTLELALSGDELDLSVMFEVQIDPITGNKTAITLEDILTVGAMTPGILKDMIDETNPNLKQNIVDAVSMAINDGDMTGYQLLVPAASVIGGIEFNTETLPSLLNTSTLTNAIETADYRTATIYLDTPGFVFDDAAVRAQVEGQLTAAMQWGDQTAVTAITPIALNLGIDVEALRAAHTLEVSTAIETMTPIDLLTPLDANPDINEPEFKARVAQAIQNMQFAAITVTAALNVVPLTTGAATGTGTTTQTEQPETPVTEGSFYTGTSYVPRDMVAQLHRGEAVVNAREVGNLGGKVEKKYYISSYGQSPHELLEIIRRADEDSSR